jgi:hypothetical protein
VPKTVRFALALSLIALLAIVLLPPSSRYVGFFNQMTLAKLQDPSQAKELRQGISLREWAERWTPPAKVVGANASRVDGNEQGVLWSEWIGIYYGALFAFVLGIVAYMLAMPFARRLPAPPLNLFLTLVLSAAGYCFDAFLRRMALADSVSPVVSSGGIMEKAWAAPEILLVCSLLVSFLPFFGAESRPRWFARWMALLRDSSFFGLALLLLALCLQSAMLSR